MSKVPGKEAFDDDSPTSFPTVMAACRCRRQSSSRLEVSGKTMLASSHVGYHGAPFPERCPSDAEPD